MLVAAVLTAAGAAGAQERVAEDQTPTGKFLTATEVRPILTATRANWVSVREYGGEDLVYVTHLIAWRCGLYEIRYAINGGQMRQWPVPECDPEAAQPAAIPDGAQVYEVHAAGSVQQITVELLYDDLSVETASFERAAVLMP
ncbi:hypothetical protein [Salinihabitans flavidus]|uniref:hypothetical protein n=1 Tax=Salinihabitans flavidus TaxID=569882 RepID=UPI000B85C097|nr:hypothetical protein [Salinihabitans flavidus]